MAVGNFEFAPPVAPDAEKETHPDEFLYNAMAQEGLLEHIDLKGALQNSVRSGIDLTPKRLAAYSLLPLRIPPLEPKLVNHGFAEDFYDSSGGSIKARQYSDGRFYKIYLNGPVGVALTYKQSPQALISFSTHRGTELFMPQIQGVRSYTTAVPLSPHDERGSRGLVPFRFPELMVRVGEEVARTIGLTSTSIKPAWMISQSQANGFLKYETAKQIYDETAQNLGYQVGSDELWRKKL